ncbi:MAG TPA: hypothetical protein VFT72_14385 [Opitutaceae bacterium]|nr:hypothetical protein [Opitutaceae bacterium]
MQSNAVVTCPKASKLWQEIVGTTREACLLRQEGREQEAVDLLQQQLPVTIRQWSNSCGESPERCREMLRELFAREQEAARIAALQRRLIVDEVCSRLQVQRNANDSVEGRVVVKEALRPLQLRHRVPIDDVVGMLDALQQAERGELAEAILPARQNFSSLSFVSQLPYPDAARE